MLTLIVTAGDGGVHAHNAARLCKHVNDISRSVKHAAVAVDLSDKIPWNELYYPPLAKLWVWRVLSRDVERVIWVDTDTYITRPILDTDLILLPFCAVEDPWTPGGTVSRRQKVFTGQRREFNHIPSYFNSGFYAATRDAEGAFELALEFEKTMFKAKPIWTREQDLFNMAIWAHFTAKSRTKSGWFNVGRQWNCIPTKHYGPPIDARVIHTVGFKHDEKQNVLNRLFAGGNIPCLQRSLPRATVKNTEAGPQE